METAPTSPRELFRRSLRALAWNYSGAAVRAVAQLAIGIVLARLLRPDQFGTVAIGWLMIGVGMLVADLGLGVLVVQRAALTAEDIAYAVTMQGAMGLALCIAGIVGADSIARWFGNPEANAVVRTMSLLFLVQSAGATPLALMRRSLDFRSLQVISIGSYLLGYVGFGIPAALHGLGPWSLVGAQGIQSIVTTVLALSRVRMRFRVRFYAPSGLAGAGLQVTGTNLVNYALLNLDSIAVGRSLGPESLGVYGRAMALVQSPSVAMTSGLQSVLFAACSRAQSDEGAVRKAFLASAGAFASLVLPLFLTVALVAPTVTEALYGRSWLAAAPVLSALSVGVALNSLASLPGPVLGALGRFEAELRVQSAAMVLMVLAVAFASMFSATAVAWSVTCIRLIQLAALSIAVCRRIRVPMILFVRVIVWPACAALVTMSATYLADRVLGGASALARLGGDMLMATASLTILLRLFGSAWAAASGFAGVLPLEKLPRFLRTWLGEVSSEEPIASSTVDGPA
jgi:PST family polysaccharide transporter